MNFGYRFRLGGFCISSWGNLYIVITAGDFGYRFRLGIWDIALGVLGYCYRRGRFQPTSSVVFVGYRFRLGEFWISPCGVGVIVIAKCAKQLCVASNASKAIVCWKQNDTT
jgi:hypothetical protein